MITRRSQPGDIVKARHPRKHDMQACKVTWVSPTSLTVQVRFMDGAVGYEFPEHDYVWVQSEAAKRWHAANSKGGFKGHARDRFQP
jgi:hypothetical protein